MLPSVLPISCWYRFSITFFFFFNLVNNFFLWAAATGTTAERAQLPRGGHQARGGKLANSASVIFVLVLLVCWVVGDRAGLWKRVVKEGQSSSRLDVYLPGNERPLLPDDGGRVHRAQCWGSLTGTKVQLPSLFSDLLVSLSSSSPSSCQSSFSFSEQIALTLCVCVSVCVCGSCSSIIDPPDYSQSPGFVATTQVSLMQYNNIALCVWKRRLQVRTQAKVPHVQWA